jgi:TPR repeat protein
LISLPLGWPERGASGIRDALQVACGALTERGIDGDALIRFGFTPELVAAVAVPAAVQMGSSGEIASDPRLAAWIRVLEGFAIRDVEDGSSETDSIFQKRLACVAGPVIAWVATAKLEDLVSLTPPTSAELSSALKNRRLDLQLFDDYRWIVDRFSTASLSGWSTSSLHREYRWRGNDNIAPPCAPALMAELSVPQQALNQEVAQRAVGPAGPASLGEDVMLMVAEMEHHAKGLLASGRFRDAAALFEFACRRSPQHPNPANDLGFCLIPEDPRNALFYLEQAARRGYTDRAINAHNQMCAWIAIGSAHEAMRVADEYWAEPGEGAGRGVIWAPPSKDADWSLEETDDARQVIAELAIELAVREGLLEEQNVWQERLSRHMGENAA